MESNLIPVVVGGVGFTLFRSDLEKFPSSFLANLSVGEEPLALDRDGHLFRYIYAYIVNGHIPSALSTAANVDDLKGVRREAEFYALPGLVTECDMALVGESKLNYSTLGTFLNSVRRSTVPERAIKIDRKDSALTRALRVDLTVPFCCKGILNSPAVTQPLYKSSTATQVNLTEMLEEAGKSSFGKGKKRVIDKTVRDSVEMNADKLEAATLQAMVADIDISALWPGRTYELRPYKLVIYQPGGHFDQHRDTVRGEGHIGTLVLILNSAYTGGELEITHAGRTEVVTGPYRWVAMYGDCLHKICPVTSGTRVSLLYDIYGQGEAHKTTGTSAVVQDRYLTHAPTTANSESSEDNDDDLEDFEDWLEQQNCDDGKPDFDAESQAGLLGPPSAVANIPAVLTKSLDVELSKYKKVVICLSHMYPAHQTVPGFLKGNDQVLYDLLKDHYRVQVVYCNILREGAWNRDVLQREYAWVFTSAPATIETAAPPGPPAVAAAPTTSTASAAAAGKGQGAVKGKGVAQAGKKGTGKTTGKKGASAVDRRKELKLVIPRGLDRACILSYTPYAEYTGNEPQPAESAYVVAGLQVMRRI